MKNYIITALYGTILLVASCEKEDLALERAQVEPDIKENNEVYTLSSKDNKGFLVEGLKIADFPKTKADFIIIPQTNLTGDVMSPFLSHPNLEKRFILSDEFDDSNSAKSYFDSYNISPEGENLQQFALNLKANQVWLVKTHSGAFCKIWIMDTRIDKTTSFVEIKFRAEKII